ncbi:MAG: MFS transporter [Clostridia bacterium]|nr:MFS transporter [Clostridia bacterium]
MVSLLIAIIYLAFISLGLPDSLLGSAWPVMRLNFNASISFAGVISMFIAGGPIVSSLLSERVTRKFGAGLVTAVSVAMTAVALFGFSVASSLFMLCLWAIPYGLGAGAVDSALNNYVALHYSSRHMSWLHCFWGVGASISPYIMSACLTRGLGWQAGYRTVSILQVVLTAILFFSLPLWKIKATKTRGAADEKNAAPLLGVMGALKIPGVPYILLAFFAYCAAESTCGLWASTYLVEYRQVAADTAAQFASLFYLGITFGRFLNGFVADRLGDRNLIRIGCSVMLLGAALILLPLQTNTLALAGLIVFGLGCAPVYPSVIHATPSNFGAENSQAIIGIQMASAYTGSTLMPPLFGLIAHHIAITVYPFYLALFAMLLFIMTEKINRLQQNQGR